MRHPLRWLSLTTSLAMLPAGVLSAQQPPPQRGGDVHVIITYQVEPVQRAEFRDMVQGPLSARFDAWKGEGVFRDYMLLYNAYTDVDTWDLMAVLTFDDYRQVARWNEVERRSPGGLTAEALRIASPRNTYLANLQWDRVTEGRRSIQDAVYFVIPYDYTGEATYQRYVETYVLPQVNGWLEAGTLTRYSIFLNRHPTGKPWDSLFIFEYADHERFGMRDDEKWGTRAELNELASWRLISDIKHQFRVENETVIADRIVPGALRAADLRE